MSTGFKNTLQVEVPRWYAVFTHARQEGRAEDNLRAWKVETFAPRISQSRYYNGALIRSIKPLFPRYIFARFKVNDLLHKVTFTRGVRGVVSFGGTPTPVDDQIIDIIKSQMTGDGYVKIAETLRAGDAVEIKDGPLKNFRGIFERAVKHSDRVMLLLTAISFQSHVEVPRELVRKVS
jgi:transcriptional antiterminator RfaH